MHKKCHGDIYKSSMSNEQKNRCVMCRTKYPASEEEATEQLRPWVEKGKAWAQCILGQRYERGLGVDQSYQRARELHELAANQGDAGSQFALGAMYYSGQGVDQSDEKAREYYEAAAVQGYANAQHDLGVIYANGQGVDQNYERAAEYYEAAAKQGKASAQLNLGALYYYGQGVEQSYETARTWWMKAAEQGNENAIKNLQFLDTMEGRTTPSFIPKPFECASCYRPHDPSEHKLRPCNRCHRVYYCGRECQVKHWKKDSWDGHKKKCNKKAK